MVKHQVDIEMVAVNRDSLLAGDKEEIAPEFEQKRLQTVHQRLFQIGLGEVRSGGQAGEFQHIGVFDQVFRAVRLRLRRFPQAVFVRRQGQTFIEKRGYLPLQFTGRPARPGAFVGKNSRASRLPTRDSNR